MDDQISEKECCEETLLGLCFDMPFSGLLEIRSSKPLDETIGRDEEVEGVVYRIYWNGIPLPWSTKTQLQATAIACGCQWGAQEMMKKFMPDK